MLCALLALQMERSGFIGNLLSMGLHRSELITGMLATLLFKFTVTFIMAIPLGYILAWVLIEKINILSFGWTMPLLWQAQSIIITGLLAGFILILSAIPVLWLTRRKPLRHWLAMARYTG
jgi:putative ABC transport system permease protein